MSSPSSSDSATAETPRERVRGGTTSQVRSATSSLDSKLYKGSLKLSRRILTLACHLNVIRNAVHRSPLGTRVNDELELVVYAAILVYVFSLPVYPAISIIAIFLMAYGARGLWDNWNSIASCVRPQLTRFADVALHSMWGISAQQLQCRIGDATDFLQPAAPGAASHASLAYIASLFSAGVGMCYRFISKNTRRFCTLLVENEECMYAMVLMCEPYIITAMLRLLSWLGICGRSRREATFRGGCPVSI